jgi:hypothetical protein
MMNTIRIAAIGAVILQGAAGVAPAQINAPFGAPSGRKGVCLPGITTSQAAKAAASRAATRRAQPAALLRLRQQAVPSRAARERSVQILAQLALALQNRATRAASPPQTARRQALPTAARLQAPLFNGTESPQQMLDRLNSLSSADIDALMRPPHWLDAFTPYWLKNAPGGNVLAQFGIGNGLMRELGARDLRKILDPKGLDSIQGRLRQAQILGNIVAGQAAQNRVYNAVQRYQNTLLADRARVEALRQLYEAAARTGLDPALETDR